MLEEADGYVDLLDWNNLLGKSYCIRLTFQTQFKSIHGILLPFLPKTRCRLKVDGHVNKFKVVQRGLKRKILKSKVDGPINEDFPVEISTIDFNRNDCPVLTF